jgi:hypothetical protein
MDIERTVYMRLCMYCFNVCSGERRIAKCLATKSPWGRGYTANFHRINFEKMEKGKGDSSACNPHRKFII